MLFQIKFLFDISINLSVLTAFSRAGNTSMIKFKNFMIFLVHRAAIINMQHFEY